MSDETILKSEFLPGNVRHFKNSYFAPWAGCKVISINDLETK